VSKLVLPDAFGRNKHLFETGSKPLLYRTKKAMPLGIDL